MHALSNYNNSGILIVTPENDLPADQAALNGNFKALATVVADYVPYTGADANVDLGSHTFQCDNYSPGFAISTDGMAHLSVISNQTTDGSGGTFSAVLGGSYSNLATCNVVGEFNSPLFEVSLGCDDFQVGAVFGANTAPTWVNIINLSSGNALEVAGGGTSLDGGAITTDGAGNILVSGTGNSGYPGGNSPALAVASGPASLDAGAITTDGSGNVSLNGTGSGDSVLTFQNYGAPGDQATITNDGNGGLLFYVQDGVTITGPGANIASDDGNFYTDGSGNAMMVSAILTGAAPSTSSSPGIKGQIAVDANYIYVCTATNTWKRAALATW